MPWRSYRSASGRVRMLIRALRLSGPRATTKPSADRQARHTARLTDPPRRQEPRPATARRVARRTLRNDQTPYRPLLGAAEASAASDRIAASAPVSTNAGDGCPALSGSPADAATHATVEAEVLDALARYRAAYEHLDAAAVASVWAAVDQRALARAFAGLRSQRIEFDRCDISAADGAATAAATCTGRATYVPAVGRRILRARPATGSSRSGAHRTGGGSSGSTSGNRRRAPASAAEAVVECDGGHEVGLEAAVGQRHEEIAVEQPGRPDVPLAFAR